MRKWGAYRSGGPTSEQRQHRSVREVVPLDCESALRLPDDLSLKHRSAAEARQFELHSRQEREADLSFDEAATQAHVDDVHRRDESIRRVYVPALTHGISGPPTVFHGRGRAIHVPISCRNLRLGRSLNP